MLLMGSSKSCGKGFPRDEESSALRRPFPDDEWAAVVRLVARRLKTLDQNLLRRVAGRVETGIQWLDPVMGGYCALTCPTCEDPCCTGQKVFFNRADIITLALLHDSLPPGQTRSEEGASCRYLAPAGCRLPRIQRPYVCVWFLCHPQMSLFQNEPAAFQRAFIRSLQEIRQGRLILESVYAEQFGDE